MFVSDLAKYVPDEDMPGATKHMHGVTYHVIKKIKYIGIAKFADKETLASIGTPSAGMATVVS